VVAKVGSIKCFKMNLAERVADGMIFLKMSRVTYGTYSRETVQTVYLHTYLQLYVQVII